MPKISIIVPVYNVYSYLDKCLKSIRNQTLKDIEVIVVNDGTKDTSQEIIDKYVALDKRFKSVVKENGGLSDARNCGMKKATGEYLAFVDGDDYIEEDMYELMYEEAKSKNFDVVECDFTWDYPDKIIEDKTCVKDNLLIDIRVVAWNKIYKRSVIEKANLKFTKGVRYEDVDWCYKVLANIESFSSVHKCLYHYIQRKNSIANTQNEKVRDIFIVLNNTLNYYKEKGIYEENKDELEYIYMRYIFGSSFKRVVKIKDKELMDQILDESYSNLIANFPNYKDNKFLKSRKDKKNKYFKLMNRTTYRLSSRIFRILK